MAIKTLLEKIYGESDSLLIARLETQINAMLSKYKKIKKAVTSEEHHLDLDDVYLVIHPWSIFSKDKSPLDSLKDFTNKVTKDVFNTFVFYPVFENDETNNISVTDFSKIDKRLGDWKDFSKLANKVKIIPKIIINSVSAESEWLKHYLNDEVNFRNFFIKSTDVEDIASIELDDSNSAMFLDFVNDKNQTVRLLSTNPNQVELNFNDPFVLIAVVGVILNLSRKGAVSIMIDRFARISKIGSTKLLGQEKMFFVFELIREIIAQDNGLFAVQTSNNIALVQNKEFMTEDKAHATVNTAFSAVALDTFIRHDLSSFTKLFNELSFITNSKATIINTLETEHGIPLDGARGIVEPEQLDSIIERIKANGGTIEYVYDGEKMIPYYGKISFYRALIDREHDDEFAQTNKFIAAQVLSLFLPGIPMMYYSSLLKASTDMSQKIDSNDWPVYNLATLVSTLKDKKLIDTKIFDAVMKIMQVRKENKALQSFVKEKEFIDHGHNLLIVRSVGYDNSEVYMILNFTNHIQVLSDERLVGINLMDSTQVKEHIELIGYAVAFIKTR